MLATRVSTCLEYIRRATVIRCQGICINMYKKLVQVDEEEIQVFKKNWPMFQTATFAISVLTVPLGAANAADSLVVENLDYDTVVAVNARPSGLTGWGPNRLVTAIQPNEHAEISLRVFGDSFCVFDVFVEDENGDWAEYTEVDLCLAPIIVYQ